MNADLGVGRRENQLPIWIAEVHRQIIRSLIRHVDQHFGSFPGSDRLRAKLADEGQVGHRLWTTLRLTLPTQALGLFLFAFFAFFAPHSFGFKALPFSFFSQASLPLS